MDNKNFNSISARYIFLFSFIFIIGFISGAIAQKGDRINGFISDYAKNVVSVRLNSDTVTVFLDAIGSYFFIFFSVFFIGFLGFGTILNSCVILCFGMGKGALLSNLVCDSGSKGMFFTILALLPGMLIAVCAILLFAAYGSSQSIRQNVRRIKSILLTFFVCLFMIVFSAGVDATFAKIYRYLSLA